MFTLAGGEAWPAEWTYMEPIERDAYQSSLLRNVRNTVSNLNFLTLLVFAQVVLLGLILWRIW